jgi:ribonuclease HI
VVLAACDGACSGNPGPGGWGSLLRFEDGSQREWGGHAAATTNNRMELTAALEVLRALRTLPRPPELAILTDSRYLVDGLEKWLPGWKRKGWRTASGSPVLNRDLWEQLDSARLEGVVLRHVRGHSGHPENDRCDAIAVAYSRGQVPSLIQGPTPASARLASGEAKATTQAEAKAKAAAEGEDKPAPAGLQRLLSRLELADRLAAGGYGLTAVELAPLVERPLAELEQRQRTWTWRDWQVEPIGQGRWRLRRPDDGAADKA